MNQSIRVGDRAIIYFENGEAEYIVDQIDGTDIYIREIDGEDLFLIYLDGDDWVIDGHEDVDFRFEPPDLVQQIGDSNVMINILTNLEYPDLIRMCDTNQEIKQLCQLDELWRIKLQKDFNFDIQTNEPLMKVYSEIYETEQYINGPCKADEERCLESLRFHTLLGATNLAPPIPHEIVGVNQAAKWGYLYALKWLNSLNPPILPNVTGANRAAEYGHLHVLKWLNHFTPPIHPGHWGFSMAAENGHLHVLKWLNSVNPQIRPYYHRTINATAEKGRLKVLKWLNSLTPPIHPDGRGANWAAENGHLHVLKWLNSLYPPILPDIRGANEAAFYGHLHVLKWLDSLTPPIHPDIIGGLFATGNETLLEWLSNLNPQPS